MSLAFRLTVLIVAPAIAACRDGQHQGAHKVQKENTMNKIIDNVKNIRAGMSEQEVEVFLGKGHFYGSGLNVIEYPFDGGFYNALYMKNDKGAQALWGMSYIKPGVEPIRLINPPTESDNRPEKLDSNNPTGR